jgi:hypothetical protein
MKISKYFNIDADILIEYIYDDSNLIGEPYNILYNTKSNIKCFVSADEIRPTPRGYKQTNNDLYNQLYRIDNIQGRYGKVPLGTLNNSISESHSFLQIRNFATSIPIRYDIIKVHVPVDYTFSNRKGFHLRIFTYDFDNTKIVELTNFFFNITDIEQNYKLEYSSPIQIINQKQWGKYVKIQIPSITKVSDQRIYNITKENSINYNLTDGLGLSKNSPIFIDFHFIDSIDSVNGNNFFNLSARKTVVVPQTPEFEKLGVKIEESSQGDFFIIYGTYNGNIAEFENFIDESYYSGNRYYAEFQIDLYEKNIKTKSNVFVVNEDFGDEIEYRPILKFTTTTAVIDVTLRLIDNSDGSFIERKSSYGMLQGGGSKMGSEPNDRLNTANGSGGGVDISKYSKNSTKINLKNSKKQEVFNIKSTILPNTGNDPFGTKPILTLKKLPFNLFSNNYYFGNNNSEVVFNKIPYIPVNKSIVYIYPFDNIIKLEIIKVNGQEPLPYDLTELENIKMVIKNDKKTLEFDIYKDSSENDFENGNIVFKVSGSKYFDIKEISSSGFDLFYITGIDSDGLKNIIYSSFFLPWDSSINNNKIENEYLKNQNISEIVEVKTEINPTEDINEVLDNNLNIPKGVNINPIDNVSNQEIKKGSGFSGSSFSFKPRWIASQNAIELGGDKKNYIKPKDNKPLEILLLKYKILKPEKISDKFKSSGFTSLNPVMPNPNLNSDKINLVLGYFKGLNIEPINGLELYYTLQSNDKFIKSTIDSKYYEDLRKDLSDYINSGLSNKRNDKGIGLTEKDVFIGEFLPKNKDIDLIKKNKIYKTNPNNNSVKFTNIQNNTNTSSGGSSNIKYSPDDDIPKGGKKL